MANMPQSLPLSACFLIFISLVSALAGEQADRVVPALQPRATFYGGYALAEQQCPSGSVACSGSAHNCCPTNTVCRSDALSELCCPSGQ
jgi:hypothetical protein